MRLAVDDVLVRIVVGVIFDALHRVRLERGVIFVDELVLADDHVLPFADQPVGEAERRKKLVWLWHCVRLGAKEHTCTAG